MSEEIASGFDGAKYNSPRTGGQFRISGTAMATVRHLTNTEKSKLTTWIVDQRLSGEQAPLVKDEQVEAAKIKRRLSFLEKTDRFLRIIEISGWNFDNYLHLLGGFLSNNGISREDIMAGCELISEDEILFFLNAIRDMGYIQQLQSGLFYLTSQGYRRIDEIRMGGQNTARAFVAMWFSPTMEAAFVNGIHPAIQSAGYNPIRIDKKEHNNKIDDEIIAEIKSSKFVVADFTSDFIGQGNEKRIESRGGVYYEAGFAHGLGTPVIFTARSDCIDYIHFDTRQISHIIWDDPDDLKNKLYNRIAATLGLANTTT